MKKKSLLIGFTLVPLFFCLAQKSAIDAVYKDFEKYATHKQLDKLNSLFLSPYIPLNIVEKTPQGPVSLNFPAVGWFDYLKTLPESHRLEISDKKYLVKGDKIAIAFANFEEYKEGQQMDYGKDVITFVNTKTGWKMLSMNNTVVLLEKGPEGETYSFDNKPSKVAQSVLNRLQTESDAVLLPHFVRGAITAWPAPDMSPDVRTYNLSNFRKMMPLSSEVIRAKKTYLRDDYIAFVEMEQKKEKVRYYVVMQATKDHGWQITTILGEKYS